MTAMVGYINSINIMIILLHIIILNYISAIILNFDKNIYI